MAAPPPSSSPPTSSPSAPTTTTTSQPPPTTTTTPSPSPTTTTTPPTTTTTTSIGLPPSTTTSTSSASSSSTISLPTTSAVPTTTSTASTTSSTTSLSTTEIVSTSGGNVITITSVTTASTRDIAPTGLPNGGTNSSHSSNGFFSNKGAVAGVFTVVGLIALAILIALITNAIRRRRARRFDDETAAAARDAANAQIPNFAYAEDDDDYRPGAYGSSAANGAKYSDASHGTYAQTPMAVQESYGMREMSPHGPNPGEYFDPQAGAMGAAAGAAGIGVARTRSMRDGGYAAGLTEGSSPYAAFATPGSNHAQSQYPHGMIRGAGGPEFDLERRPSQMTQQTDYSALSRNKSYNGAQSVIPPSYHSEHSYVPSSSDSGSAYSQGQQGGYPNSFNAFATNGQQRLQTIPAARSEEDLSMAYGGYTSEPLEPRVAHSPSPPPGQLPNPFSTPAGLHDDLEGHSDDEDEPRRVLKVANE